MKRQPSPSGRLAKNAGATPGGYLSGIKAAAASVAATSTFATTSKAIANAAPPGRSPIDLEWLGTPSARTPSGNHHLSARPLRSPSPSTASSRLKTPSSARSSAPQPPRSAPPPVGSQPHHASHEQEWSIRRKTLRVVLQPTASSAAPFFEAMGCNAGAIGIIRLPRNAAAHVYPSAIAGTRSPRGSTANCDFFLTARDEQSRTEWQVALQLELEGSSSHDALSAHNQNRRALHSQQELEEAVSSRDVLVRELAACEKELLELKLTSAATNQREAAALVNNASLLQHVNKLEAELRFSENQRHELRGRMSQVAATADSEHSRLASAECALREQNTAQLKRIAILEERVEASQRLHSEHHGALDKLSVLEGQLQRVTEEKRDATRDLHARIERCKSLERQLSMARESSAVDEKDMFAARAAAARALDEAAACRLKCNELDGVSWSHKDKLSKAQDALAPLRKRADAAEQTVDKYERQLEEARQTERQMKAQLSQFEKENRDLKSDVQSLAAEKQCMRLELLQANLENDRVSALRATIKSLEQEKAELVARDRQSRVGGGGK